MPAEPITARPKPSATASQATRRIGTGEDAAGGRPGPPTDPPAVVAPGSPGHVTHARLARALAEALAAWWRRTHPDDPDLAR
jgi:hypothetical protein